MGYYMECTDGRKVDKGTWLVDHAGAQFLIAPPTKVPKGMVPVCVVDNVDRGFEAAGIAYNQRELDTFADKKDKRPKQWFLVPIAKAVDFCGKPGVSEVIAW